MKGFFRSCFFKFSAITTIGRLYALKLSKYPSSFLWKLNRKDQCKVIYGLEIIGYLGGFLIAIALAPQLIKTWKTKSARDISLLWTSISLTGLILYGVYAALNGVYPLLTFAVIEAA
ncbi:MAG: PQ-loop repeat-containing protein [Candidatus Aenigmarchaeota archaeon]|nr:PQ-loop repeat-containing protein [Candidatus Aenigmarchaeota archaeon]